MFIPLRKKAVFPFFYAEGIQKWQDIMCVDLPKLTSDLRTREGIRKQLFDWNQT